LLGIGGIAVLALFAGLPASKVVLGGGTDAFVFCNISDYLVSVP